MPAPGIAERLGVDVGTVRADISAAKQESVARSLGDTWFAQRLDLARVDALIDAWWDSATEGSMQLTQDGPILTGPDDHAAAILIRLLELRARILRYDAVPVPADDSMAARPYADLDIATLSARVDAARKLLGTAP